MDMECETVVVHGMKSADNPTGETMINKSDYEADPGSYHLVGAEPKVEGAEPKVEKAMKKAKESA